MIESMRLEHPCYLSFSVALGARRAEDYIERRDALGLS